MTLVQLRHFVTLAELGSFVKAAKALYVTQPALSRSIKALEDELGQALFDRVGRRNELTAYGLDVLDKAKQLLSAANSFRESGQAAQAALSGHLRLGLSSGPGALLTTPLLLHAARDYPLLHLAISRGSPELMLHALRARLLDAIVVDTRSLRPASDLSITLLTEMSASFLCRSEHPLARLQRPITFQELLDFPLASTPLSDEVARKLTEQYGNDANPDAFITLRCDDIHSLVEVAQSSDAILLAINAVGRDLVRLEVSPPMRATARFGLVTLVQRAEAPAMPMVRELMQRFLHD